MESTSSRRRRGIARTAGRRFSAMALALAVLLATAVYGLVKRGQDVQDRHSDGSAMTFGSETRACNVALDQDGQTVLEPVNEAGGELNYDAVAAGVLLPDGGAVIGSRLPSLVFFSESGVVRRRTGRSGAGPGEYSRIDMIWTAGDGSVAVFDRRKASVTYYSPDGDLLKRVQLPFSFRTGMSPVARLVDGSWLATANGPGSAIRGGERGVRVDTVSYLHIGDDGSVLDTLGTVVGTTRYGDMLRAREGLMFFSIIPFTPMPGAVALSDSVVLIAPASVGGKALVVSIDGRRLAEIAMPDFSIPLNDARITEFKERLLASEQGARLRWLRNVLDEIPYPEATPPFHGPGIRSDPARDAVWIPDSGPPHGSDELRIAVITARGEVINTFVLRGVERILDVGEHAVLVISRTQMDEEVASIIPIECTPVH